MNDKMDMHSPDMISENIKRIDKLFPGCVTETAEGLKIDFDQLKQELSDDIVDGSKERYRLDWPGKREAIVTANLPTTATLRPVREESVDFDTTENLYIEGDNLEVLKVLQESYLGKIKMIYIDPPYNTGKDFVYRDNFATETDEWKANEERDETGNRLVVNPETAGRYHSDWLSMMYPRLKLARNLLTEDGVIFISIDDNEVHNLRKICDEIFGEGNFQAQIIPIVNPGGRDYKQIAVTNEYILLFSKDDSLVINEIPKKVEFSFNDSKGGYELRELRNRNPRFHSGNRPNLFYPFYVNPDNFKDGYCTVSLVPNMEHTVEVKPYNSQGRESVWRWGQQKANEAIIVNNHDLSQILAKQKRDGNWNIYEKNRRNTTKVKSIWNETEMRTENGTREVRALFESTIFDHPKPLELIKRCIQIGSNEGDIILDFFAGSATTAHATLQLNHELKYELNRKFILVQLDENVLENSNAFEAGYKTITEIGKERIRRAAVQIKQSLALKALSDNSDLFSNNRQENNKKNKPDLGFRVYKLDSSNMKDVYYNPMKIEQGQLDMFENNIKEGRTDEDLVAQVMLDWGLPLSLPIEQKEFAGKKLYAVADDSLYCCFDNGINEAFAREVAEDRPLRIVFCDSGFKDDTAKENVKQLLKQLSPETEMRVI